MSSTCFATSSSSSSRARQSRSSGRAAPGSPRCCPSSCASRSRRPAGFVVGERRSREPRSEGMATPHGLRATAPDALPGDRRRQHQARRARCSRRGGSRGRRTRARARLRPRTSRRVRDGGRRGWPRPLGGREAACRARARVPAGCAAGAARRADGRPRSGERLDRRRRGRRCCARAGRSCSSRTGPSSQSVPTGSSASAPWRRPSREDDPSLARGSPTCPAAGWRSPWCSGRSPSDSGSR